MDPAHGGSYHSATSRDDGEVRLVVDIFNHTPPNYNDSVTGVSGAPATRRPEIDLNNPAQREEDSPVHAPINDAPVQQAPVRDDTGSNYGSIHGSSSGGGYVDWARGSIDVGSDGNLAFYENAHPPTEPVRSHGDTGFDLNAAVREAQEREEEYFQERLENLCKGKAMEDQFLDMSFRNSSPAEDPSHYKLWND